MSDASGGRGPKGEQVATDAIDLSPATLRRHAQDARQFAGAEESTRPDGMRLVRLYNAAGLSLELLPDRALDVWRASYRGLPLTWLSAGSPHRADAAAPWLQLFSGGLLTTCGLRHVGPPEEDAESGEPTDLHGAVTRLPARGVTVTQGWEALREGVSVTGTVDEARLFGPQLRLERRYRMPLERPEIELVDTVTNAGDLPQPLMMLYHVNVGYPLVRAGATLRVAGDEEPVPRDAAARAGLAQWSHYEGPAAGYDEQVFFHRAAAGRDGWSRARIGHPALALEVAWDARAAPYLTQWKNTRRGMYVCGVEPANALPEGRNRAREQGRLERLEPGEARTFRLTLRALAGEADWSDAEARMERTGREGTPPSLDLSGYPA